MVDRLVAGFDNPQGDSAGPWDTLGTEVFLDVPANTVTSAAEDLALAGVGQSLTLHGQDTGGGADTAGDTILRAGKGSVHGVLRLMDGGSQSRITIGATGDVTVNAASTMSLNIAGVGPRIFVLPAEVRILANNLQFDADVVSPFIGQRNKTTAAAIGKSFLFHSQDVTGTGATVGGGLLIRGGNATGAADANIGGDVDIRPGAHGGFAGSVSGELGLQDSLSNDVLKITDAGAEFKRAVYSDGTAIDDTDSPYAVSVGDYVLEVDSTVGPVIVDLPTAVSSAGRWLWIVDVGGQAGVNNITVDAAGGDLINGLGIAVLAAPYASMTLRCNNAGTVWSIM